MQNNNQKLHNILLEIVVKKKEDLLLQQPDITLQQFHKISKKKNDSKFKKIFNTEKMVFIGEIKFASPTNPNLGKQSDLLKRAEAYEKNGIDAISIITEKHFFKGDPSFVTQVKKKINLPILQKDFVIDGVQIYEAKAKGADALLLIARLLNQETLSLFVNLCFTLGIEPVVEINNTEDLEKAIKTKTNIIAVNARDLETFAVNVSRACKLLQQIPNTFIKLGFSGIHSKEEVAQYKKAGAKGVLVGTSLMKAKNIKSFLSSLRANRESAAISNKIASSPAKPDPRNDSTVKVKICGIRTLENAQAAIAAGADFLGFNFVPTSKRYIHPKDAKEIICEQRAKGKGQRVKMVGVFQNQPVEEINTIAENLDLDFVQLHGKEDDTYMKKVKKPIIKKVNHESRITNYGKEPVRRNSYFALLDRVIQGEGDMIDLDRAKEVAQQYKTFFSGGLTPENVAGVVKKVKPFAVDVAGGIETDGEIDSDKVKRFIENAKNMSLRGGTTKQSRDRDRRASLAMTGEEKGL